MGVAQPVPGMIYRVTTRKVHEQDSFEDQPFVTILKVNDDNLTYQWSDLLEDEPNLCLYPFQWGDEVDYWGLVPDLPLTEEDLLWE